jgi:hypothetical protein
MVPVVVPINENYTFIKVFRNVASTIIDVAAIIAAVYATTPVLSRKQLFLF